jgi:hypothetical protein
MTEMNQPRLPWWRVGLMWLVVGGPLVVIAAGTATAIIAVATADRVVHSPASQSAATMPATQARNHAAQQR